MYKLTLTRGYSILDFREDLQKVCRMAGVHGTNTVFLLTDADIVKVEINEGKVVKAIFVGFPCIRDDIYVCDRISTFL